MSYFKKSYLRDLMSTNQLLIQRIAELGRGDLNLASATNTIRKAVLYTTPPLINDVYEALHNFTLYALAARSFLNEDLAQWHDLFKHAANLIRKHDAPTCSRIEALAGLISQSVRFAELHPLNEVLTRPGVKKILETLAESGGRAELSELVSTTSTKPTVITRTLWILAVRGLLSRNKFGSKGSYELTDLGYKSLGLESASRAEAVLTSAQAARASGLNAGD